MTRIVRPIAVTATALLIGAGLALATAMPAMADTPPTGAVIDQQQTDTVPGLCAPAGDLAQTFTAGIAGVLTSVHVDFPSHFGAGSVSVLVETTTAGIPSGTVLAIGDSQEKTFTGDLNLSDDVPVTPGTQYALVFPASLAGPCAGATSYAGGESLAFQDGAWVKVNADWVFATYVVPDPTATNATATVQDGKSVGIPLTFTAGATPSVATAPAHGSVTFAGSTATYTPTAGFVGTDTFTYTATNAAGISDPATVTVTVTPPAPALAETGVDSAWLVWPAVGLLVLGILAVVIVSIVRRRRV